MKKSARIRESCCVVLGGYVNGYSIIQELYEKGIKEIILLDTYKNISSYSNKIRKFIKLRKDKSDLCSVLRSINKAYKKLILYPTDDSFIEELFFIYEDISSFCFIPFNKNNILQISRKSVQYKYCHKLNIPYPKTVVISTLVHVSKILKMQFPVLIKPDKREDLKIKIFRNLVLKNEKEYNLNKIKIESFLLKGVSFLVSEIIPGDGSNIYAYVAYRSPKGEILNEWTGKKLSQFPNDFGVFSSASNEAPDIIAFQGRKLLEGMDIQGIAQPEFKYDYRDGKYKLMEINLRSMMWHRVGNLSNVNLQYSQYLDAIGEVVVKQKQEKNKTLHFVYLVHEIVNLLSRRKYINVFLYNLFKSDKKEFAVFDIKDMKPFIMNIINIPKKLIGTWLRKYII